MKQRISNTFFGLLIVAGLSAFVYNNVAPPKTYTVSLTLEDWRGVLQVIDTTSKLLNESDIPVRKVIYANQGLASITNAISYQVSAQMKEEAKKDSTNAVKPKK